MSKGDNSVLDVKMEYCARFRKVILVCQMFKEDKSVPDVERGYMCVRCRKGILVCQMCKCVSQN